MSIKEQISEVQAKVDELKYKLAIEEAVLDRLKFISSPKKSRKPSGRRTGPPRKGSLAARLENVLQEAGCALSVNQLVARLKQTGFASTAKVGLNNLIPSAMVRRPDIFVRVKHGVYDLKSRQKENLLTE